MAKPKQSTKKRKKVWLTILSPKEFNNKEIGETYIYTPESAIGKRISCNLSSLVNDVKRQNINILLGIKEIKENRANTEIIGYEIIPAYLKRLSKISKGKAEQSFKLKTKDNVGIIIKPAVFVKNKSTNKVLTSLRKKIEDLIKKEASEKTYDQLADEIMFFKLQKRFNKELKKIVPISNFIIKKFNKLK